MIKDLRIKIKREVFGKMGFTLVELLIVISILSIMVAILVGTLNPIALINKANDSRRKNDLNKIKIAFEAYYTDKGTYPSASEISEWNIDENCGKGIAQMKSYLRTLPCDPKKTHYEIVYVDRNTFKAITNLDNKKDSHIPPGWYTDGTYVSYSDRKNQVNYGVSSSNILWYDVEGGVDKICGLDCTRKIRGDVPRPVTDDVCISGGDILCFWGQATGNNFGVPLPEIPDQTPQCYVDRCCSGSGCN